MNNNTGAISVEEFKSKIMFAMRSYDTGLYYLLCRCPHALRNGMVPLFDESRIVVNNFAPMNLRYYASEFNLKMTFVWDESISFDDYTYGLAIESSLPKGGHSVVFEEVEPHEIPADGIDLSKPETLKSLRFIEEDIKIINKDLVITVDYLGVDINGRYDIEVVQRSKGLIPYAFSLTEKQWVERQTKDVISWHKLIQRFEDDTISTPDNSPLILLDYVPHKDAFEHIENYMFSMDMSEEEIDIFKEAYYPRQRKESTNSTLWLMMHRINLAFNK